jgi:hypothetical protein
MPIDLMYCTENEKNLPVTQYAAVTKKSLEDAYRCVRQKVSASHARRKDY